MKVLVTGGAGFIGSNFIHHLLKGRPDWTVVNFDALTYAGNLANLEDIENNPKYTFVKGDISNPDDVRKVFEDGIDYVINFAAETHVDRSLYIPALFLKTNVLGTQTLLNAALEYGVKRFLQVSTDEVYGSLGKDGCFSESSPLSPNSPYAASKASADLVCLAHFRTFKLPVVITRSGNNYGPYQFPEKLIPFFIIRALNDEPLPLYGDGLNVRDWLYVEDNCEAILTALERGENGRIYNIGGDSELTNLEVTKRILAALDKPETLIKFVKDRPAHDRRYALDYTKIREELGWQPKTGFSAGLTKTVDWYRSHQEWCRDVTSGEYRSFYERHYRERQ